MKTREEVEYLKQNWYDDPCWDIEETYGFEDYWDELCAYRIGCEAEWKKKDAIAMFDKSIYLGIPGNIKLVRYINKLEAIIKNLEERIERLEE